MSFRLALHAVAAWFVVDGLAGTLGAQDRAHVPDATLLKRTAEALEGHYDRAPRHVVVHTGTNTVVAVLDSHESAVATATRLGERHVVLGPFLPPAPSLGLPAREVDLGPLADIVPDGCVHDGYTSNMIGLICNSVTTRMRDVAGMTLTFRMRDGTTRNVTLPPGTDAVFLSLAAHDKFVFPYYQRIVGVDGASAMRQQMVAGLAERARRASVPARRPAP